MLYPALTTLFNLHTVSCLAVSATFEDLDEDILSTLLNKKRLPAAGENYKHLHNAVPKVELEVFSRDFILWKHKIKR
jgi:hypothetical protein